MKKLSLTFLSVLLALSLAACKCTAERKAVDEMEKSRELISTKLLKYVEKDPALKPADKDDWKKLVETDKRNTQALKKALE